MEIKLVVKHGRSTIRTLHIRGTKIVFGRAHGCKVRIPCADVSRRHCRLSARDGYVTIEDLKSKNGTLLNGKWITGREVVRPGDCLQIGPFTFVVEYQLSPEALNRLLQPEEEPLDEVELVEEEEVGVEMVQESVDEPLSVDPELQLDAQDHGEPGTTPVSATQVEQEIVEPVVDQAAAADGVWELPDNEDLHHLLSGLDDKSGLRAKRDPKKPS